MDGVSTVTLVRELDKRIEYLSDDDDFFNTLEDVAIQELKVAVNGCLTQYTDVIVQRVVDNME